MFLQGTGNQEKDVEDRFRAPVSRTKGSLHLHPSVPQTSVSACSPGAKTVPGCVAKFSSSSESTEWWSIFMTVAGLSANYSTCFLYCFIC